MASKQAWRLQFSRRKGGKYYQMVGSGDRRRTVTVGYLSEDEVTLATDNLGYWYDLWVRTAKGNLFTLEPERLRAVLLSAPEVDVEDLFAERLVEDVAESNLHAGAYGDLMLRHFYDRVFGPVRQAEVASKTWHEESTWAWPRILRALGDVPVKRLDTVRWTRFLLVRTTSRSGARPSCSRPTGRVSGTRPRSVLFPPCMPSVASRGPTPA